MAPCEAGAVSVAVCAQVEESGGLSISQPPRTFRSLLTAFKEKIQPREPRAVRSDPASLPEVIHLGSMEQERERETPFSAVRHHHAPFPPPLAVG